MKTNDDLGRQPNEDRFDQILRLVREMQACLATLRTEVHELRSRHDSDWRVLEMRETSTLVWRQETREAIKELNTRFEVLRDASRGLGVFDPKLIVALLAGAGVSGWAVIQLFVKGGSP